MNIGELSYPQKYIFFASVYDFEGEEPVGELEFALALANKVGFDNLLVKVHPRDDVNRFKNVGLNVDKNSQMPWEVIQLNYDFSDSVFITVASTSVLTISLIVDKSPKIYFAHRLFCSQNSVFKKAKCFCEEMIDQNIKKLANICFLNSIEELSI